MKYIGVRSSTCAPNKDTDYWGSSKYIPDDAKLTHKKRVLAVFASRKQALEHEISLHKKYDVAVSPLFYNRSKQTVTGFDTTGTTQSVDQRAVNSFINTGMVRSDINRIIVSKSKEGKKASAQTRNKMSLGQKRYASSPGYVNPRKGVTLSDKTKLLISLSKKEHGKDRGINNVTFSPWFIFDVVTRETERFYEKTKTEAAIERGLSPHAYRTLYAKSKGVKPATRGRFANKVIGNLPKID
jgi:hypothetical protein